MYVKNYEDARRQAQANADRSGKAWILWMWGGNYHISQDWPTRAFDAIETFKQVVRAKKWTI